MHNYPGYLQRYINHDGVQVFELNLYINSDYS